jgi:integrase
MAPKPMSTTTVNKNIIRISSLFEWSSRHGYVDKNYFEGLVLKTKTRADEERSIFTKDDLKDIFKHVIYTELKYKHPYQYWLPLLGLYTGARLEELCQLYPEDIYNDEGIWVIDINDKGDKKLKTKSSKRIIPIHSKLQALGFIDYVESLRHKGESRLFPELKKGRDGYSQSASKWFSRLRMELGLYNLDPPKDFHSFRHTLATELKNKSIPEPEVAAITGHSIAGITFSRYGKAYVTEYSMMP